MAPVLETDLEETRWEREQWRDFELWELIEARARRMRRNLVVAVAFVSLLLCSVPVVMDGIPKWAAAAATRRLGQEILALERMAVLEGGAFRIRFKGEGSLDFDVLKLADCTKPGGSVIREGTLHRSKHSDSLRVVRPGRGKELGLDGLRESICYEATVGFDGAAGEVPHGFAIAPVSDLEEGRLDRMAALVFDAASGEIHFD